jgi:hypothetical protein
MTTLKDPIRQSSLFTPCGLIDPRLMPDHAKNLLEGKIELRRTIQSIIHRLKLLSSNFFLWKRNEVRYINLDKINLSKRR